MISANGQEVAPEATAAVPADPAARTAAATVQPSAATTTAGPDEPAAGKSTAAGADPLAAAAATLPADQRPRQPTSPPPASGYPTAVSGVGAASANQVPDAPAAPGSPANDDALLVPDVQPARDQRATSAIESLSPPASGYAASGNGTSTTATQQGNPISGPPIAAAQTALHNTTASGGSSTTQTADTSLSQADRVRFVQRVEQVFQDLDGQGGSVRLRLSPPELGSLHIEINVGKGEMTARIQAETPAARNVLLDNLPVLRERLAQHDIKVQSFDVDLMDRSSGGMSNQSSQYQNPAQQNPSGMFVHAPLRGNSELPDTVAAAPSRPVSDGGRLNVVV